MSDIKEQEKAPELVNQISFGGKGGGFTQLGDVGGQNLLISANESYIDMIQIGNLKFGNQGGRVTTSTKLPMDGKIYLLELQFVHELLCYFKAVISGDPFEAGVSGHPNAVVLTLPNTPVRFSGISSGTRIDALYFTPTTTP